MVRSSGPEILPKPKNFDLIMKNCLIDMLKESPIHMISEFQICQKLKFNQSTFYRYYLDVFDLLQKTENALFRSCRRHMRDVTINSISDFVREFTKYLCKKNRYLYSSIWKILERKICKKTF